MDAARLAKRLAHECDTHDPYKICKLLGILVLLHPLVGVRGYYKQVGDLDFIVIADDLPEHVARFVCAHELGHKLLHSGLNRVFMDSRTCMETNRYENSADRFACNLLFYELPLFRDEPLTNWDMAECLNVPVCNVDSRLIELGVYY